MHAYAITESILDASREVLDIDEGSMYPALYRMQKRGWIEAEWGRSENNRRAKFYAMTGAGRRQLEAAGFRLRTRSGCCSSTPGTRIGAPSPASNQWLSSAMRCGNACTPAMRTSPGKRFISTPARS